MTYWCPECKRNHKFTSEIGKAHLEHKIVEPGPEEVSSDHIGDVVKANSLGSPDGDAGQGMPETFSEPSPAPAIPSPEGIEEGGAPPTVEEMFVHTMQQITTLSANDQVLSQRIENMEKVMYEATQPPGEASDAWEGWSFDSIPDWLHDPLTNLMGDIGAAARGFAGGTPAQTEDEQVVRAAITIMREKASERIASRAALMAEAMEDPDTELYSRKKDKPKTPEEKDVKKVG